MNGRAPWLERLRMLFLVGMLAPAAMAAAGFALAYILRREVLPLLHWPTWWSIGAGVFTALLSMGLISGLYRLDKRLERALRETGTKTALDALESVGYPVMMILVVMSGFGEEALFRGGLQPTVGIVVAALLFGFSHGGWRKEMLPYVLAASISGALFGVLYRVSGDLWAPITAHAVHNALSTALMGKTIDWSWKGIVPVIRLIPEPLDDDSDVLSGDTAAGEGPAAGSGDAADAGSPAAGAGDAAGAAAPGDEPGDTGISGSEGAAMTDWMSPYPARRAARELGVTPGILAPGPKNCLTDVAGVRVGHATVVEGEGALVPGSGPVRTGVTAILPHPGNLFAEKVPAGVFVLNGFGKSTGLAQIQELGTLETPILLTNTLSTFRAADALVTYMIEQNPSIGIQTGTVNPMVGECNDGFLNDIQGRHVTEEHVRHALMTATDGPVAQGAVGAGTGMVCYGFKGGIGSSSRTTGDYTVGALVLANFGKRASLIVAGEPVGQRLVDYPGEEGPEPDDVPPGSIMVILATDAPLDSRQLTRLAKRGALGLARTGASASNGSGDFVLAFSTQNQVAHESDSPLATVTLLRDGTPALDQLFLAAVEAVEESVLNGLFGARTVVGRDGHTAYAMPVQRVLEWVKQG